MMIKVGRAVTLEYFLSIFIIKKQILVSPMYMPIYDVSTKNKQSNLYIKVLSNISIAFSMSKILLSKYAQDNTGLLF